MIAAKKKITYTVEYDGVEWEVSYRNRGNNVECTATVYLYVGEELKETITQPVERSVYENWGSDDVVIQNWLFQQMNITVD